MYVNYLDLLSIDAARYCTVTWDLRSNMIDFLFSMSSPVCDTIMINDQWGSCLVSAVAPHCLAALNLDIMNEKRRYWWNTGEQRENVRDLARALDLYIFHWWIGGCGLSSLCPDSVIFEIVEKSEPAIPVNSNIFVNSSNDSRPQFLEFLGFS